MCDYKTKVSFDRLKSLPGAANSLLRSLIVVATLSGPATEVRAEVPSQDHAWTADTLLKNLKQIAELGDLRKLESIERILRVRFHVIPAFARTHDDPIVLWVSLVSNDPQIERRIFFELAIDNPERIEPDRRIALLEFKYIVSDFCISPKMISDVVGSEHRVLLQPNEGTARHYELADSLNSRLTMNARFDPPPQECASTIFVEQNRKQ